MPDIVVREGASLRSRKVGSVDFLSFILAGELYAVELRAVQEIVVPPPITWVPRAPAAVEGVCSVRGELITVVGLRLALNFPTTPRDRRHRILLGRTASDELIGLHVDEVCQVVRLLPSEIEQTVQSLGGDVSDAVRGIGRPYMSEPLVLLDMAALMAKGVA